VHNHLELLAYVARADGEVSLEEALAIRGFMDAAGIPPREVARIDRLLDPLTTLDIEAAIEEFASAASPWMLAEAVRDAYVIAAVDGVVEESEIRAVERLLDMLCVPGELRQPIHRWAKAAAIAQLRGMRMMGQVLAQIQTERDEAAQGRARLGTMRPPTRRPE